MEIASIVRNALAPGFNSGILHTNDTEFSHFPKQWGGWGIEVREASKIAPALRQAREMVAKSAVVNIWVDPNEYAPGTKNQTMYK